MVSLTIPKTTRAQVLSRARQGFGDGLYRTPYDQNVLKGGYRTDCSGYVSRCLGLLGTGWPASTWWGGLSTVSLLSTGVLKPIPLNTLQPGDLCGNLGPDTGGDAGHVVVFSGWLTTDPTDDRYSIFEQAGGMADDRGPIYREITWPYPGETSWGAYRYAGIIDAAPVPAGTTQEDDMAHRFMIRKTGTVPVYLTDGMRRWWVPTRAVYQDVVAPTGQARLTGVPVADHIEDVADLAAFGPLVIDPEYGPPPGVQLYAAK